MLDVTKSPELQAAIYAMRQADSGIRRDINKTVRSSINPQWTGALRARAKSTAEEAVIVKGARTKTGSDRFSLTAATSRRPLRGGLVPADEWAGYEFGAASRRATFQTRSRKGKPYQVTKVINRQFRSRTKQGRIAFDAGSEIGTWAVTTWVRDIVYGLAARMGADVER